MTVQPGWYPDPAEPDTQRYWDGDGWIGTPLPADATPPPGPPPPEPEPSAEPEPGAGAADERPTVGLAKVPPGPPAGAPPTGPPPGGAPAFPGAQPGGPHFPGAQPGGAQPGNPPPGWPYPYGPPPPRPHGLALAPLGLRFAARLVDIGIVFLLNVVVNGWFVLQFVREIAPISEEFTRRLLTGETGEGLPKASARADSLQVVILLIAVALWFAYEVPAVANTGQTFGKRLLGIKVVTLTEQPQLGFGRSLRRWNLLGLAVFLWSCCGIGFLLQLISCAVALFDRPLQQALHDKRAQTVVVQLPRQPTRPAPTGAKEHSDPQEDRINDQR